MARPAGKGSAGDHHGGQVMSADFVQLPLRATSFDRGQPLALGLGAPEHPLPRPPCAADAPHQRAGAAGGGVQQGGQDEVEPVAVAESVQADVLEQLPGSEGDHAQDGGEGVALGRHRVQGQRDAGGPEDRHRADGQRPGAQRAGGGDEQEGDDGARVTEREGGRHRSGDQHGHEECGRGRHVPAHQLRPGPHHGLDAGQQDQSRPVVGSLHGAPRPWPRPHGVLEPEADAALHPGMQKGRRRGAGLYLRFDRAIIPLPEDRASSRS
ncbi:hypothetical protein [Streptomyces sp. NPDC088766]|uniref:hypothetical protein n=1 Tax=Streptomyces sp. NPDC088766 TaxID=3365893 RepID=UPI0038132474